MADRRINLSQMDFQGIKSNLISFMKAQDSGVADYNFEGSAVNTVMDMLAYITHANAVNANMSLNEAFLDTAQLRESVVSHAKLLGYTPRSTTAATAKINITVTGTTDGTGTPNWNTVNDVPQELTIPYGTVVTTQFNNKSHNLIVGADTTVQPTGNTWIFYDVPLIHGVLETRQYVYDETNSERYYCYDSYVDTKWMSIDVFTSSTSSNYTTFTRSTNIVNIKPTSPVYFLEESREGFYEILFGDDKIGKKLSLGNIIKLTYIVVGNDSINGARTFNISSINGNSNVSITTITAAKGGVSREGLNSIKYNAPRAYIAQNRAVTPDDYKAILQNEYGNIQTMAVWGGEDNEPPEYGKVFISIKPTGDADNLTANQKTDIITNYLKPKNVVSISPELVDPNYIDINITADFQYDPNVTNLSGIALANNIRSILQSYDDNKLQLFGGIFRHSNILKAIDDSNVSIVSSVTNITMSKSFSVTLGAATNYKIEFNQQLANIGVGNKITSNTFVYKGNICLLKDYFNATEGKQIIQIVNTGDQVVNPNIGYIDLALGCIYLDQFTPESLVGVAGNTLKITTKSASPDIKPLRNDLLRLNASGAIITPHIDNVVTGGAAAAVNYTTTQTTGGY